jgi:phosphatidylinositol-3-phosphatase
VAALLLVVAPALSACSSRPAAQPRASGTTTTAGTTAPPARPGPHILVLVMENHSYGDIVGNPDAPYQTMLARTYETATDSHAVGHHSLDNYLAILSGLFDPWSTDDCDPGPGCQTTDPSFPGQLDAAGIPWDAYMGSMPTDCDRHDDDNGVPGQSYAVRHDPFVYFPHLVATDCQRIRPGSMMLGALDGPSPPDFVWYSPQICDDGGGDDPCSTVAAGDRFVSQEIPAIQATAWYHDGGVIVLTYDEGDEAGQGTGEYLNGKGNHILTVVVSAATRNKPNLTAYVNHFGLLAGLERAYHLACLAQACAATNGLLPLS